VPLAVAGQRPRVDRVHDQPGALQRDDEQVLVGLDRDRDGLDVVGVLGQQPHQLHEPGGSGVDPQPAQDLPVLVHDGDIVVGLGPVDAAGDAQRVFSCSGRAGGAGRARGSMRRPHGSARGAASHQPITIPATGRTTVYI
jgi:hypothetical protein